MEMQLTVFCSKGWEMESFCIKHRGEMPGLSVTQHLGTTSLQINKKKKKNKLVIKLEEFP